MTRKNNFLRSGLGSSSVTRYEFEMLRYCGKKVKLKVRKVWVLILTFVEIICRETGRESHFHAKKRLKSKIEVMKGRCESFMRI